MSNYDAKLAASRRWKARNRERMRQAFKTWRQANLKAERERSRIWQHDHREACRNSQRLRRNRNSDKIRMQQRIWYAMNRTKLSQRIKLARYHLSNEEFQEMLRNQQNRCVVCCREFTSTLVPHIDHNHSCCPRKAESCGRCIRGLLCRTCNAALFIIENEQLRASAIRYLYEFASEHRSVAEKVA